jgi:hypothetical protein
LSKALPTALVALAVGVLAAYIAWQQHRTARAKLKLDLFEKRYAIFESTWAFLSKAVQAGAGDSPLTGFDVLIPQASFLFGRNVEAYMREASAKHRDLWFIEDRARRNSCVTSEADIASQTALLTWFADQADTGVKDVFRPYLDFENWR